MTNNRGIRQLLIAGMTREQLIKFIRRKDSSHSETNFSGYSNEQLYQLANDVDQKSRRKKDEK
jgi:hypothetical protein